MGPLRSAAVLVAGVVLTALPAVAQQVGTATASNPLTQSTPPGGATVALTVGARVVHKERIHTAPSGSAQLLFLDKSTLSIAPNTNILIDEFVYDPNSGNGHMLAKLTEGALRYVGGKLSHEGETTVATPEAAIGIRGGTATIHRDKHNGNDHYETVVINHFGIITISNGAGTVVIRRPGFMVTIEGWNAPPGDPALVFEEQTDRDLRLLTSKPGENGGVPGLKNVFIGDCIIGAAQGTIGAGCPQRPWMDTDAGESDAFQLIIQATQHATPTYGQRSSRRNRY